jgi:prolyl-tRNA editing enzyme YbaK/EbsC (Cys-tRNA(Pro) deacylase)
MPAVGNPKIFVGASSEAEEHDQLVRDVLEEVGITVIPWQQSFRPGEYGLDSLGRIAREAHGAILIASADDRTWYRGQEQFSPRDNVLFELGYFMQALARRNTVIVQVEDSKGNTPRVPTDLAGLTVIQFRIGDRAGNASQISQWATRFRESFRPLLPEATEIMDLLRREFRKVHPSWESSMRELVLKPFRYSVASALRGEILLTPGQYYSCLEQEIRRARSGTIILAVSSTSSQVWATDRDQQSYFNRNIDAARKGVVIRRLFVIPTDFHAGLETVIQLQNQAGVEIRVASPDLSAHFSTLEDIVIFIESEQPPVMRGYVGLPAFDNPGRIRGGKLLLDLPQCQHQRELFESAWILATPPRKVTAASGYAAPTRPPGESMEPTWLGTPVVSCREAARARGVPLKNELKSLIIDTSSGLIAAHLRGDQAISLRAVKQILESDEARLASRQTLQQLGLSPGTVSAVLDPVWSLPHLIERSVIELDFVTTNNRRTTGYFRFDPKVLLSAPSYTLADFARPQTSS